jgi:hypothetical protein
VYKLSISTVAEPVVYFESLGGLHDARITAFKWDKIDRRFIICIDDLNSNFLDLPEYKGLQPAEVIFLNVESLDGGFQIIDSTYSIYAMEIKQDNDDYKIDIRCSPSGYFKLCCKKIEIR